MDRREEEIRALLDDVIERIVRTCKQLSACAYTTDDSVEEVQRKLWESKVCSSRKIGKKTRNMLKFIQSKKVLPMLGRMQVN